MLFITQRLASHGLICGMEELCCGLLGFPQKFKGALVGNVSREAFRKPWKTLCISSLQILPYRRFESYLQCNTPECLRFSKVAECRMRVARRSAGLLQTGRDPCLDHRRVAKPTTSPRQRAAGCQSSLLFAHSPHKLRRQLPPQLLLRTNDRHLQVARALSLLKCCKIAFSVDSVQSCSLNEVV